MISKKAIKLFGLKVRSMIYCGGTFYYWDSANEKLVRAHNFLVFNMAYGGSFGMMLSLIHGIHMYITSNLEPDDEEGGAEEDGAMHIFATRMFQVGEMIIMTCISFLCLTIVLKLDDFIYLTNQIFTYNKWFTEMLKSKNIELDADHKRAIKLLDILMITVFIISAILPFALASCVLHPIEPTHILMEDMFEVEVGFYGFFIPLLGLIAASMYGCGNLVVMLCWNIAFYYMISTTCLQDLMPVEVDRRLHGKRAMMLTNFFGVMDDNDILKITPSNLSKQILVELCQSYWVIM
ncbi:unnamed protein product [Orchesella dallaii]|uniref:Odorant receptor n=1 Tax=Orchesella dallaii TaxID=48710 RepID=A0ABP1QUT7_9HEXA